jgi:anti-sigma regulatory factor (Ser/Thr protein kinase)
VGFLLFEGACDVNTAAFVRRRLRELGTAEQVRTQVIDDLELAATELITNAVNAGAQWLSAQIDFAVDRTTLEVSDDARGMPAVAHPGPADEHGRGLQIIGSVADEWGMRIMAIGKTVWAAFGA